MTERSEFRRYRHDLLAGTLGLSVATILIVDDRPVDRIRLASVLRSHRHTIVEALDGDAALRRAAEIRPDVVICSVLLPTLDGCEFVRALRRQSSLAAASVIFMSPTYHEREARAMADQCGVFDVLTSASPPEEIQEAVDAALESETFATDAPFARHGFDREQWRITSLTAAAAIQRFEAERDQIAATLEAAVRAAAERDPAALLKTVCAETRRIVLAQHASAGVLAGDGPAVDAFRTSGVAPAIEAAMRPSSIDGAVLSVVIGERRAMRRRKPDNRPDSLGLTPTHPPVSSFLIVPIASPARPYGWLFLGNKLGTDEFTDADERVAVALGAFAGIAYENSRLRSR